MLAGRALGLSPDCPPNIEFGGRGVNGINADYLEFTKFVIIVFFYYIIIRVPRPSRPDVARARSPGGPSYDASSLNMKAGAAR